VLLAFFSLPIPSSKKVDDLERELYVLKKRIQTIERGWLTCARLKYINPFQEG